MIRDYGPPPSTPYAELPDFEVPTPEEIEQVNALYPAYIFFEQRKAGRMLQTSCCHRSELFPDLRQTMKGSEWQASYGKHNEEAICPFCSREAQLKNIGRLGKRTKLSHYEPVVFLKEREGDLYALAFWTRKTYKEELAAPAEFMFIGAYRYTPGKATVTWPAIGNSESDDRELFSESLQGNYDPNHRKIKEPFTEGGYMYIHYVPYSVIGIDAIQNSAFRYCQYYRYHQKPALHTALMRYLSACCIYPRNIEMLMKGGLESLVWDLVSGRRKNADVIKWGVDDPCRAFGLARPALKEFLKTKDIDTIRVFKSMIRSQERPRYQDAENIEHCLRDDAVPFLKLCRRYALKPMQGLRYLDKFTGPRCGGMGMFTVHSAYIMWRDYLQAADAIGYDLQNEVVLLPKNLDLAHNEATGEHSRRLQAQRQQERAQLDEAERQRIREMEEKAREVLMTRQKAYNFLGEHYLIRVAETADEVIAEGKVLEHCVGGYAQRHIEGKLTICLLRSVEDPETPLCTVEMSTGRQLVQIHGYRNEREGGPQPREAYAEILTPWLKWVAGGSKRDKDGKPILPREKKSKKIKEATAA